MTHEIHTSSSTALSQRIYGDLRYTALLVTTHEDTDVKREQRHEYLKLYYT